MALRRWIATAIALLAGCFFAVGLCIYELALLIAGLHPNSDDDSEPTDGSDEY